MQKNCFVQYTGLVYHCIKKGDKYLIVFAGEKPGVYFWKTGQKYNFTGLPFKSTSNFQASFTEGRTKCKYWLRTVICNGWAPGNWLWGQFCLPGLTPFLKKARTKQKQLSSCWRPHWNPLPTLLLDILSLISKLWMPFDTWKNQTVLTFAPNAMFSGSSKVLISWESWYAFPVANIKEELLK